MFQTFSFYHVGFLAQAATWTLLLSMIALVSGGLFGAIVALARVSPFAPLRWITSAYIYVVQGTPLLVLLFLAYFGVALAGYDVPALVAAAFAFTIYAAAFLAEIWRGCIEAIGTGQWEGAKALGLSWSRTMRLVIVPQAMRLAVPPTVGFFVQLVKNTALASVIGFVELTRAGQIVANSTFQPLSVYLTVGAMYFVICSILSFVSRQLDARITVNAASTAAH
ncbi:amino acid ABC transporter permease [Terrarubrum flagellatum]|uniref:amino acid ABC transporter permease n=1 Tax=Terrirubrum flagellatum TaxID=2895980 RepID=UPI003144FC43